MSLLPGAGGVFVPGAALLSMGAGVPDTTESPVRWLDRYASPNEVTINIMAAAVVALLRKVDAPVLPNSVWLEPPPKAAPMSAPLPVWSKTIMISAMLTIT